MQEIFLSMKNFAKNVWEVSAVQNFMKSRLPKVYSRNFHDAYLDPIREKLIYVTPEETVRQHVISYLLKNLKVPKNLICVEEPLKHYGIKTKDRADIIIDRYDEETENFYPLAVIECKAPEIFLDDKAREQLFGYSEELGNKYCWLTNGEENYFYYLENDEYIEIDELPSYAEMLGGKYNPAPVEEIESIKNFEELEKKYLDYVDEGNIGEYTPKNLAIPMTNFLECLMNVERKFPAKKYKIFTMIEDYGIRNLTVGDAGSNKYTSQHRSFLVEYKGNKNFVSLAVYIDNPIYICIAIDRDNRAVHHSLQLNVDKNFETYDKKIRFLHDGRITKGQGALPVEGLRNLVSEKYPEIIKGKKFYLGTLTHNRLWYLDDIEVMQVIENLISYALIRDDYREIFS